MGKKGYSKIIGFIIFILAIIFLALLAKNKGDFGAIINDIKSIF